jgi:hypothetical protein
MMTEADLTHADVLRTLWLARAARSRPAEAARIKALLPHLILENLKDIAVLSRRLEAGKSQNG